MILIVECGRTKINQSNLTIKQDSSLSGSPCRAVGGRWYVAVVSKCLILVVDQQNIFWFEVGMNEIEIMKDYSNISASTFNRTTIGLTGNTGEQLSCKVLNLTAWERHETIALEKVEHTLTKQVCDNANMIAEVKGVSQMYAFVSIRLVIQRES